MTGTATWRNARPGSGKSAKTWRCLLRVALVAVSALPIVATALEVHEHRDGVLGTSLDISVYADERNAARATLTATTLTATTLTESIRQTLGLIATLEKTLSTYDRDSELSRLNRRGALPRSSTALRDVLALCERWRVQSSGSFSCLLGNITRLWRRAEERQRVPDRVAVRKQARALGRLGAFSPSRVLSQSGEPGAPGPVGVLSQSGEPGAPGSVGALSQSGEPGAPGSVGVLSESGQSGAHNPSGAFSPVQFKTFSPLEAESFADTQTLSGIQLPAQVNIDADGLAKGYIIDRALEDLRRRLPAATAIKVDIGGDARYWGAPPGARHWRVAIADPQHTRDNGDFLATLALRDRAVAASGHRARARKIEYRRFSHILDPADGWPVSDTPAAIVVAADAATADAVATALSAQPARRGLDWVNRLPGVEALLISAGGLQQASNHWRDAIAGERDPQTRDRFDFTLDYTIPKIETQAYHRPYLAIWISDRDNKAVRHLLLLGDSERWVRENRRWWRRVGRKNPALIDGVARPTRRPGEYRVQWNGLDDFGNPLAPGEYFLHLEAARENGAHVYEKIDLSLDQTPFTRQLPGNGELGPIGIRYRPAAATPPD